MNSPLFSSAPFVINGEDEGTTQFANAFTNAQFSATKLPGYQVLLSATLGAPLTISVDAGPVGNATAAVFSLGGTQCGTNPDGINPPATIGVININTIDPATAELHYRQRPQRHTVSIFRYLQCGDVDRCRQQPK